MNSFYYKLLGGQMNHFIQLEAIDLEKSKSLSLSIVWGTDPNSIRSTWNPFDFPWGGLNIPSFNTYLGIGHLVWVWLKPKAHLLCSIFHELLGPQPNYGYMRNCSQAVLSMRILVSPEGFDKNKEELILSSKQKRTNLLWDW